jgi:hypothetical protein
MSPVFKRAGNPSFAWWLSLSLLAACGGEDADGGNEPPDTEMPDGGLDGSTPDEGPDTEVPDAVQPDVDPGGDTEADTDPGPVSGNLSCSGSTSATVSPGSAARIETEVEGGSVPLRLDFEGREVTSTTEVTLNCGGSSIVPTGYIALSPPFRVEAPLDRFARNWLVTMPFDLSALPAGAGPSSLTVFYQRQADHAVVQPVVINMQENMRRGNVRFQSDITGTFQIAVSADAGSTRDRRWQFRAITGISMGANGASMIAMRHPELFDIVGPLGGPTDWNYLMHYIRVGGMGGVGPAPGFGPLPMVPDQEFEHAQTLDEWFFPTGEGTGGSFNRNDYSQIFLDLMLSFGNIVAYNDASPFAAPGLPLSELQRPARERCSFTASCGTNEGVFRIERGYFDDEFNPDGSRPVITFCDGRGSQDRARPFARACDIDRDGNPDETNQGLYDDPCAQIRPMDISFAVDLNNNGIRDPGEPIVRNFHEPFRDVGADGVPDAEEPGYDPVTNPDPNGDNYDYVRNPLGTEGNWLWDDGEPWEDWGLDGVEGTPQLSEGGYDFGEGNGRFDYNPNLADLLFSRNPTHNIRTADGETLEDLTWYIDAGIRDLFNFAVSGNHLVAGLQARGQNVRVYDGFYQLQDLEREEANQYNFTQVDYRNLGEHVYLRYGDRDASAEEICFGDGKHVGTALQIANRLLTLLGFVTNRFPDGDTTVLTPPYPLATGTYYVPSPSLGGVMRYSIAFPPGYERTQCNDGVDNDRDGVADGMDPDCANGAGLSESGQTGLTLCTDGIDNDLDGLIDELDPDCASGDGSSEWPAGFAMRDARFPVVYLLHGYGQTPDDLQVTAVPFSGYMAQGLWPKVILVFPDGFCGNIEVTQCNDGVDNDGDGLVDRADPGCAESNGRSESGAFVAYCADGVDNDRDGLVDMEDGGCSNPEWDTEANCLRGNFYTDHQAWPDGRGDGPAYEAMILDLIEHIDETYRTRSSAVFPETR